LNVSFKNEAFRGLRQAGKGCGGIVISLIQSATCKLSFVGLPSWHVPFYTIQANNKNTEEDLTMKKTLSTLMLTVFVVLITATFSFAEYAAAGAANFPYFHLGALIVGGMTIVSLKQKYEKLYMSEAVGSFAMFAVMVALFTSPVAETVKNLIG
jgi:hypothetical protein